MGSAALLWRSCIQEEKLNDLIAYMQRNESGMQTFDQHLLAMYQGKLISGTEALRWATKPEALAMAMRGIKRIGGIA